MRHPEFPTVSFLCLLLLVCSLPSHIRARSVCTLALIAWLAVMSIIRGVNSLIWANNFVVRLEVWCDITTKITIGFTYAIPASALCILRHLESVASTRNAQTTKADKRRRQIFEVVMCFGIPLLFMALHYIVQGHRFDLIEDVGCVPFVYFSVAAVIIVWVPPFLMSLITFTYAALSLRHFLRRRIEFAAHLQNSQSAISPGRYFRLMMLAVVEMVWDTGVNAYIIYFNTFTGLRPWISWDNVHSNFSRVGIFPEFIIPPEFVSQLIWQWWIVPISCFTFFIFFGFGEEAMSDYRIALFWLRRHILRQDIQKSNRSGAHTELPIHRRLCTQHIDLRLSAAGGDISCQEHKAWNDDLLKMVDITDRARMSRPFNSPDLKGPSPSVSTFIVGPTSGNHSTTSADCSSPEFSENSTMNILLESSFRQDSITDPRSSSPTMTMSSSVLPCGVILSCPTPTPPSPRVCFPVVSPSSSSHNSTMTDDGISISPVHPPDVDAASVYCHPVSHDNRPPIHP